MKSGLESCSKFISTREINIILARQKFQEIKNKYKHYSPIDTDASKNLHNAAFSITIGQRIIKIGNLPNITSI